MATALIKHTKTKNKVPKQPKLRHLTGTPNYITILPPGEIIAEKMFEMGINAAELARRMKVPAETIEKLVRQEIPLTKDVAKKLEKATWNLMMRHEVDYREQWKYAMDHPEIPAYFDDEIINPSKQKIKKKGCV